MAACSTTRYDDYTLHFQRIIYKRRVVDLKEKEQIHMPLDLTTLGMRNSSDVCASSARERNGFSRAAQGLLPITTMLGDAISNQQRWRSVCKSGAGMISATHSRARCVVLVSTRLWSGTPCTSKVVLAMNVYDKASTEDIRDGLRVVTKALLGSDLLPKKCATSGCEAA